MLLIPGLSTAYRRTSIGLTIGFHHLQCSDFSLIVCAQQQALESALNPSLHSTLAASTCLLTVPFALLKTSSPSSEMQLTSHLLGKSFGASLAPKVYQHPPVDPFPNVPGLDCVTGSVRQKRSCVSSKVKVSKTTAGPRIPLSHSLLLSLLSLPRKPLPTPCDQP